MRQVLTVYFLLLTALPVYADAVTERLLEVLDAPRLLSQLAIEAERSGQDIDRDFLGGRGGAVLADTVTRLNDPVRVLPQIEASLTDLLDEDTRLAVTSFFESDLGQRIVSLELSARATIFDPSIEQAVRQRILDDGLPELVADIMVQGDLVERNVIDAMSVLKQFYLGRMKGGAADMTPAEVDAFLEESIDGLRFETQSWLEAFMTLAYSPLSDEDLQIYAEFWRTEAGQAFDRALFAAFEQVFAESAFALGQLVGRLEASDEI